MCNFCRQLWELDLFNVSEPCVAKTWQAQLVGFNKKKPLKASYIDFKFIYYQSI